MAGRGGVVIGGRRWEGGHPALNTAAEDFGGVAGGEGGGRKRVPEVWARGMAQRAVWWSPVDSGVCWRAE